MNRIYFVIVAFLINVVSVQAQIPNNGFENWTSFGNYNNPDSWDCLNDMTSSMSVFTCMKGTPGSPGTAYIKLQSKTVSGMGIVPGVAVSGVLNETSMLPVSGFPFSQRPASLTGNWQHMIFGSSQGFIDVQLTRWDAINQQRVIVASAHHVLVGMAMSWAGFAIPLLYAESNYPDSCMISLSASGSIPANGDYLWVDNLSFSGTVTGIQSFENENNLIAYPNPVNDVLYFEGLAFMNLKVEIQITDMQGKIAKSMNRVIATDNMTVDISELAAGNYIIHLVSENRKVTHFFIKE